MAHRYTPATWPTYRLRRIVERLTELPQATVKDMQELQYDVLSTHARDLLPILLAHVDDCELKRRLTAWDCRYTPESTDASLFQDFYRHILLEIFGHEAGIGWRRMMYLTTRMGYSKFLLTACDRALRKVTSSWWQKRDKGEMIRRATKLAQAEPDKPWAKVNEFHFVNRFINMGSVGRLLGLRSPPIAMPGCHATPVSRPPANDQNPRKHLCPQLSLRDRHGHRRSLDQPPRRPQRERV